MKTYNSQGGLTDMFDVHHSEFVGVDCLLAGTQHCVVRYSFI